MTVVCGDDRGVRAAFSQPVGNQHAERLVGVVKEVLTKAGIQLSDVGLVGVINGPGSFTGLRVGISFIEGLAIALGIKTIGVNALDALAHAALDSGGRLVSPVIDARKGQVYAAIYDVGSGAPKLLSEYSAVRPEDWFAGLAAGTVVIGSGAETYKGMISDDHKHLVILDETIATISPKVIYDMTISGPPIDPLELDAFYIRQADAICKPKQR
ncbi:MAG: tRNA (adenosine(37)-N6)-threonylcarbamoyltransferase complex dimerization subunit type 1 TsaB [Candidatus Edwardsbacteria bacterium]|nr:tRNA (adenosine(37)-N6)-threonylcarbamoyltransferase complex dimerization subunit type 1 TsaB [Candidatus Edwardsbacteria bacterium]